MKIAFVTGARNWPDQECVNEMLSAFQPQLVIHGHCPTGADHFAQRWAEKHGIFALPIKALWAEDGERAAGPVRNGELVQIAKILSRRHQVCFFAFPLPGGTGTQDCVRKAKRAELTVCEVRVRTDD